MSEIDLRRHIRLLRRWWWLILLVTSIGIAVSLFVSLKAPRIYLSTITLLVGQEIATTRVSLDDITVSQRVAGVYASMVKRQPILEATVKALKLPIDWRQLQANILVFRPEGSQLLEIRVTDTNPQRAAAIATELARQLIIHSPTAENAVEDQKRDAFTRQQLDTLQANIQQAEAQRQEKQQALQRETSARGVLDLQDEIQALDLKLAAWRNAYAAMIGTQDRRRPDSLSVIEPAFVSDQPVSPNVTGNVLLAAVSSLALAVVSVFLIEHFISGRRLTSVDELTGLFGAAPLGRISYLGRFTQPRDGLVVLDQPNSPHAEAFRHLRTNIQFLCRSVQSPVFLMSSANPREGKSLLLANLGVSFSLAGKRTVLVDADLRRPSLHTYFGVSNRRGLASLLSTELPVDSATYGKSAVSDALVNLVGMHLRSTVVEGLKILPAGVRSAQNPAEVLSSPQMLEVIAALRQEHDVVIIDCPPVLAVSDTPILAAMGLPIVLVCELNQTRVQDLVAARNTLNRLQAEILGVVVNRAPKSNLSSVYYYYQDEHHASPAVVSLTRSLDRAFGHRVSVTSDWRRIVTAQRTAAPTIQDLLTDKQQRS